MLAFELQDDVPTILASGKLSPDDYQAIDLAISRLTSTRNPLRLLVILDGFEGWEPQALSQDIELSCQLQHRIERLAVVNPDVGSEAKVDSVLTQPLFAERVRVFPGDKLPAARAWLTALQT